MSWTSAAMLESNVCGWFKKRRPGGRWKGNAGGRSKEALHFKQHWWTSLESGWPSELREKEAIQTRSKYLSPEGPRTIKSTAQQLRGDPTTVRVTLCYAMWLCTVEVKWQKDASNLVSLSCSDWLCLHFNTLIRPQFFPWQSGTVVFLQNPLHAQYPDIACLGWIFEFSLS